VERIWAVTGEQDFPMPFRVSATLHVRQFHAESANADCRRCCDDARRHRERIGTLELCKQRWPSIRRRAQFSDFL
jgi:hypothetical protein